MAVSARIKFVQGATVGVAGEALFGVVGVDVDCSNDDDADVNRWIWTVLAIPPGSSVPLGVASDGPTSTFTFGPDVRGGYHVELQVFHSNGVFATDRRVFQVPEASGRYIPPFEASASGLNFLGQERGWSPTMEDYLKLLDGGAPLVASATGTIDNLASQASAKDADAIRLTGAVPALAGLASPRDGRRVVVIFVNAGSLKNEAGSSTAANRILTGSGADLSVSANTAIQLRYDSAIGRWITVGGAGGSGSSAVANDIAKSAGTTIDRVRGITGVPFAVTSDGAAAALVGAVPVFNAVGGSSIKFKKPAPWFDVTNYGADPTGVADSSAAFEACHDAIGGANSKGATIFIPEGVYRLDSPWVIAKNVKIRGAGMSGGNGGTVLNMAAGASIIFCASSMGQKYPFPTIAQEARIEDLGILKQGRMTVTARAINTAVTKGTKRIPTLLVTNQLDDGRHIYLECLKNGTTVNSTTFVAPTEPDMFSADFVPGATYQFGELVRGTNNNAAMASDGANLITDRLFRCTTAGVAGGTYPTWLTGLGPPVPDTTTTGSATFTAIDNANYWVNDNGVIWAAKSDAAIVGFCRVHMHNLHIEDAGGPGVYLRGNSSASIATNCNGWTASNLRIVHCGIGIMTHGSDVGAGVATMIDVEGAGKGMPAGAVPLTSGGIGIYEASGTVGNAWIGCQVANVPNNSLVDPTGGGYHSYYATGGAQAAQFINCYAEGFGGGVNAITASHFPGVNTIVLGGPHSAQFTDESYPAFDGQYTQAQLLVDSNHSGWRNVFVRTNISNASNQDKSGLTASITEQTPTFNNARNIISGDMRVTGLTGLVSTDVGRYLTLSNCTNTHYNGSWRIGTVVSATEAFVTANSKSLTDSDSGQDVPNGNIHWYVGGGSVSSYLGSRDFNGAVIGWTGPGYDNNEKNHLCQAKVFTDAGGWPGDDWWVCTSNGAKAMASFAISGVHTTFGADGAAVGEPIFHVPSRVWFGNPAGYLRSIEFLAAAPASLRHAQGSIAFNNAVAVGSPIGWMTTATNTPGTQVALPILPDWNTEITAQQTAVWRDTAQTGSATSPKVGVRTRRVQVQTTTATASQVLEDGATDGSEDFILPASSMTHICITHTLKKVSTAFGGSIRVEADYVRDGSGAPTIIGTPTITYNLSGSTLDGTTVALVVNGNRVEYQCSPESADTLNHRIVRTQLEGVD